MRPSAFTNTRFFPLNLPFKYGFLLLITALLSFIVFVSFFGIINETEYNKYLDELMGLDLTDEDETLFEDDMKYLSGEIRYF